MSDWDAARFLPSISPVRPAWYLRFGIAGHAVPVDGIFVAAFAVRDSLELEPWEDAALGETLDWFNAHLRAPHPGNLRARFFVRSDSPQMVARFWELHDILRCLGVPVEMVAVRHPGTVVVEDEHQAAFIPRRT